MSHLLHRKRAADTTEIVAIQKIGLAVLAECQNQPRHSTYVSHLDRKRIGAAEVPVAIVERLPVGRREEITAARRALQVGAEPEDGLPVGPFRSVLGIAGRDEDRMTVVTDAARRPHAPARSARAPGIDRSRIIETYSDDPSMILTAVTKVPAIGNQECTIDDRQRTALILNQRREREPARPESLGDIHREAGNNRSIIDRQAEYLVLRARSVLRIDHRVEVDR